MVLLKSKIRHPNGVFIQIQIETAQNIQTGQREDDIRCVVHGKGGDRNGKCAGQREGGKGNKTYRAVVT